MLTASDIGGAAFGSAQSVPDASTTGVSASTRTGMKTGSSSQDGGNLSNPTATADPFQPPGSSGGDGGSGRPQRRARASIRTTSRLNAAYAIEMMRAEGAADMRHIMDSLAEQQPDQVDLV